MNIQAPIRNPYACSRLLALLEKTPRTIGLIALAAAFLFPCVCRADSFVPFVLVFTPDTMVPASILTVLIICIEAIVLWRWMKALRFLVHLGRSTLINLASGIAGSVVFFLTIHRRGPWDDAGFIFFLLFILTLVVETPVLKVLYRREVRSWTLASMISIVMNVISYAAVFVGSFVLFFLYLSYARYADAQKEKLWNDTSLLENKSGVIYNAYERIEKGYKSVLKRYDVPSRKCSTIDPGLENGIDPNVWDARGDVLAYVAGRPYGKIRSLYLVSGPLSNPALQISGDFMGARIAPDLTKVAALEYTERAWAPRDEKSHYMLGLAGSLKIFDAQTGKLLQEAPRMTVNKGFCWTEDSKSVLFTSLRDERFLKQKSEPHSTGYSREYAQEGQFPIDIYAYDTTTNSAKFMVEGIDPVIIESTGELTFLREKGNDSDELWQMDPATGKTSLVLGGIRGHHHAMSPDGQQLLMQVPHKYPFGESSFLVLTDVGNPERRLVLQSYSRNDFRWVP